MLVIHYRQASFVIFMVICIACLPEKVSDRKKMVQTQDIDIQIESATRRGDEIKITYVVKSLVEKTLYLIDEAPTPAGYYKFPNELGLDFPSLEPYPPGYDDVDDSMPLLIISKKDKLLEIWVGVPPLGRKKNNTQFITMLLSVPIKLPAKSMHRKTVILKKPFWKSEYFLQNKEELISFLEKKIIEAVIIVGYGYAPIGEISPDKWQLIAQSEIFRIEK